MAEKQAQVNTIRYNNKEDDVLIPSTRHQDYGGASNDILREEPGQDVHQPKQTVPCGQKHAKLCSWKCCGMLSVALLALVLTGVLSGVTVHYTLRNERPATYQVERHATYKVVGSKECNDSTPGTSLVYTGVLTGFQSETGYINYQCMPINGNVHYYNGSNYTGSSSDAQVINGDLVKYNTFHDDSDNQIVACALCRINGRDTLEIQPATNECLDGWTKEYEGYLMTGGLCVHTDMVGWEPGTQPDEHYIHHEAFFDAIAGNGYNEDFVLSCAVCSR